MAQHNIWPEGFPEKSEHTESPWTAFWIVLRMQVASLFPLGQARRIRHAISREMLDPYAIEQQLKQSRTKQRQKAP